MQNEKDRTSPEEITVSDQTFNRLTFRKLGEEKDSLKYVYDGRGYKFVRSPITGNLSTEPEPLFDVSILFGAWDDAEEKWFAFYSADCFDPPMYLVNARSFEDAYESFTDEFIDAIKVDDSRHEFELEAKSDYAGNWNELDEKTKESKLNDAANKLMENGVISYNPSGKAYWAENLNGFELELIRAEKV